MSQKNLESAEQRGQVPDQVLIPQLSLHSMYWRPKYQNDSNWLVHVPVAFWLVEATKPQRLVELGSGDGASWLAFCQAVERVVPFAECTGFTAAAPDESLVQYTQEQYQEFAALEQATQAQALERLAPESIDLLHIAPGIAGYIEKKWDQWQARLSPRAVVVISQAGAGQPGEALFQRLKVLYPHFLFQQGDGLAVVAAGAQQSETLQRLVSFSAGQQAHRLIQQVFSRLGLACLAKPGQSPEQLRAAEALKLESDKLKEENAELADANTLLQAQHQQLEAELRRTREESQEAKMSLAVLEETQQAASAQLAELQQRLEATARERGELAEHNRAHQQEQEARFNEIAKLTQRLQQVELSAKATEQALEEEIDSLKRELVAERNAKQQAEQQRNEHRQQLERIQAEVASTKHSLKTLESDKAQLQQDIQAQKQARQQLQQQLAKLQPQLTQLQQQFSVTEAELKSAQQQAEQQRNEHRQQLERLQAEAAESNSTLKVLNAYKEKLQQDKETLKQAQEELQQQLAQLRQQLRDQQKENEYLLGEQQRRFSELAELTRRLESKDQQLERLQAYLKTQPAQAKGWRLGRTSRKRQEEMQLVQASGLFNEAWYLEHYPEVKRHRLTPLEYFLQHGGQAGHSPGPDFDTTWYLSEYPDVAGSGMHPLLHYLKFGKQEARQTTPEAVAR